MAGLHLRHLRLLRRLTSLFMVAPPEIDWRGFLLHIYGKISKSVGREPPLRLENGRQMGIFEKEGVKKSTKWRLAAS